jgi:Mg-chelatase subunit ChlD
VAETAFEEMLRRLDIAFVIDTTGSMGAGIGQVQKKLNYFAQTIAGASTRPDVAFGVVAYRDHPPEDLTYVTQVYPLSRELGKVQEVLNGLQAEGGGDDPEAVMDGLWDALQESQWRTSSYKVIVLVGDAPAHERCPRELNFDMIIKEARQREILIFSVGTSSDALMSRQFKLLADATGGLFARLDDIGTLIEKILSLLEQTVIVDMEVSLAVYNRRMAGLSASEIAKQIGRPESEVTAVMRSLEKKGAKWPSASPIRSEAEPGMPRPPTPASTKTPVVGTVPIGAPTSEPSQLISRPTIVPITNLTAQPTYQVRWMGWQGAQGYDLQEASDPSFTRAKTVYSGTDTSWTAQDQPTGTYFYRVRMQDAAGRWGEWSETQSTVVS